MNNNKNRTILNNKFHVIIITIQLKNHRHISLVRTSRLRSEHIAAHSPASLAKVRLGMPVSKTRKQSNDIFPVILVAGVEEKEEEEEVQ